MSKKKRFKKDKIHRQLGSLHSRKSYVKEDKIHRQLGSLHSRKSYVKEDKIQRRQDSKATWSLHSRKSYVKDKIHRQLGVYIAGRVMSKKTRFIGNLESTLLSMHEKPIWE